MPTQLETILAHTTAEVAERRSTVDSRVLEERAAAHAPRGFEAALRRRAEDGFAIIAELKRLLRPKG